MVPVPKCYVLSFPLVCGPIAISSPILLPALLSVSFFVII